MRFDTLFNEYYYARKAKEKITAEVVNDTVSKSSKTNCWLFSIFLGLLISASVANIVQLWTYVPAFISGAFWVSAFIAVTILAIVNSNAQKRYERIKGNGREYSKNRINDTVNLLTEYNIDVNDKDSLKKLVEEAKINKSKYDLFVQFKKPLKAVYALLVPCAVYIGQKFAELRLENESVSSLITRLEEPIIVFFLLLLLILVLSTLVFPELDKIIKGKYYYHDEFMEDVRQIILFYKADKTNNETAKSNNEAEDSSSKKNDIKQ